MPMAAPTSCRYPGCRKPVPKGYCSEHQRDRETDKKQADARRGSSTERGYDHRWRLFARSYLNRGENATCCVCAKANRVEPATDVDHIRPWRSGATPEECTRLKWSEANLQPLCHRHHSEKTAKEDGAFGRAKVAR